MEIDFLGLNSPKFGMEQESSKKVFAHTEGGVETSLSLSTSSSLDSHREILNFSEKNKRTWEFLPCDKMIPSCSGSTLCGLAPYNHENPSKTAEQPGLLLVATPVFHRPSAAGFLYDLNDAAKTKLRNMSEIQAEPPTSLTMLYSGCPNVFNEPEKAENAMYIAGNASTRLSRSGYTPTVAMARRATLARFLEKRLHRMQQGRTSHLMGKSLNATNSEACDSTITRSNKKRNSNLKRRS